MSAISVADFRPLLDFEGAASELHLHARVKARFVREEFGVSLTRYAQILNAAIDLPEARRYAPLLVARLRRLRDERRQARQVVNPPRPAADPWYPSLDLARPRAAANGGR